jgi:hypothetical protein
MSENPEIVYDDAFTVIKQRWGTYISMDLEGNKVVTSMTKEQCISGTRWYLKAKQEGFQDPETNYEGEVGGKL